MRQEEEHGMEAGTVQGGQVEGGMSTVAKLINEAKQRQRRGIRKF